MGDLQNKYDRHFNSYYDYPSKAIVGEGHSIPDEVTDKFPSRFGGTPLKQKAVKLRQRTFASVSIQGILAYLLPMIRVFYMEEREGRNEFYLDLNGIAAIGLFCFAVYSMYKRLTKS